MTGLGCRWGLFCGECRGRGSPFQTGFPPHTFVTCIHVQGRLKHRNALPLDPTVGLILGPCEGPREGGGFHMREVTLYIAPLHSARLARGRTRTHTFVRAHASMSIRSRTQRECAAFHYLSEAVPTCADLRDPGANRPPSSSMPSALPVRCRWRRQHIKTNVLF